MGKKLLVPVCFFLGLCFSFAQPLFAAELLKNPGLEGKYGTQGNPPEWYAVNWGNCQGVYSAETTDVHNGKSLKLEARQYQDGGFRIFQILPVEKGKVYEFSFWLKVSGVKRVAARMLPRKGKFPLEEVVIDNPSSEWKKYTVNFIARESDEAEIALEIRETGALWVDDLSFSVVGELPPALEGDLLFNGSFEGAFPITGPFLGVAPSWRTGIWGKNTGSFFEETHDVHSGQRSQGLKIEDIVDGGFQLLQFVNLEKDKHYRLVFWVKADGISSIAGRIQYRGEVKPGVEMESINVNLKGNAWEKYTVDFYVRKSGEALAIIDVRQKGVLLIDDISLVAIPGENVELKKGNLIRNSSFEVGYDGWAPVCTVPSDPNLAFYAQVDEIFGASDTFHGKHSAKLTSRNPSLEGQFLRINPDKTYTLSLFLKGNTDGIPTTFSIRSGYRSRAEGPTYEVKKEVKITKEWQRYSVSGELKAFSGNGYQVCITVAPGNGQVWVDAVQLEEGALTDYQPYAPVEVAGYIKGNPGVIFEDGQGINLTTRIYAESNYQEVPLKYDFVDYYGNNIKSVVKKVRPLETAEWTDNFKVDQLGMFHIYITPETTKDKSIRSETIFALLPKVESVEKTDSFFGGHFVPFPYETDTAKKIGMRWLRLFDMANFITQWPYIEPKKGVIVWNNEKLRELNDPRADYFRPNTDYDQMLSFYKNYGMSFLGTMYLVPLWANRAPDKFAWEAPSYPPKEMADWINYVRTVVGHYKNYIKCWEVWNEPYNSWSWHGTPEEYVELLKVTYQTIKEVDPTATVVGGCVNPHIPAFPEAIFKAGALNYMDVLSFHGYFDPWADSDYYEKVLVRLRDMMKKYGRELPLWNTEFATACKYFQSDIYAGLRGDNISVPEPDYKPACSALVRVYTVNIANGVKKLFWYFMCSRFSYSDMYDNGTMFSINGSPTALVAAHATFASLMENVRFVKKIVLQDAVTAYLFDKNGSPVVVYWAKTDQSENAEILLPVNSKSIKIVDLMANERKLSGGENTCKLPVLNNSEPIFLMGVNLSTEKMGQAMESGQLIGFKTEESISANYQFKGTQKIKASTWFTVDLNPYSNMGFQDEVAGDGKGGWSDEGRYNDMRGMLTGKQEYFKIPFNVIDPKNNNGRSCLVLNSPSRGPLFPDKITGIKIAKKCRYLYFLQAASNGGDGLPVGYYQINYRDGTSTVVKIRVGENVVDWWADPKHSLVKNAEPIKVITGYDLNVNRYMYAFEWENPYPEKEISTLDFISEKNIPIPILIAITGIAP